MKTFDYAAFKQQWLTRCKELKIDPAVGPTSYQVALLKAEQEIERKRKLAGWWDVDIHGRARDVGDVGEEQSTWNIEVRSEIKPGDPDDWRDDDFEDLTIDDLWLSVKHAIRAEASPATYEAWRESFRRLSSREKRDDLEPVI